MKWFVFGLTMACSPVLASSLETCKQVEQYAKAVMEVRQEGVPMSAVVDSIQDIDKAFRPVFYYIVESAYSKYRFVTDVRKLDAITDFRDEIFIQCMASGD